MSAREEASLSGLPKELFEHLLGEVEHKDLVLLSSCSKWLRRRLLERIFVSTEIDWRCYQSADGSYHVVAPLERHVRFFDRHPELWSRIRKLNIRVIEYYPPQSHWAAFDQLLNRLCALLEQSSALECQVRTCADFSSKTFFLEALRLRDVQLPSIRRLSVVGIKMLPFAAHCPNVEQVLSEREGDIEENVDCAMQGITMSALATSAIQDATKLSRLTLVLNMDQMGWAFISQLSQLPCAFTLLDLAIKAHNDPDYSTSSGDPRFVLMFSLPLFRQLRRLTYLCPLLLRPSHDEHQSAHAFAVECADLAPRLSRFCFDDDSAAIQITTLSRGADGIKIEQRTPSEPYRYFGFPYFEDDDK